MDGWHNRLASLLASEAHLESDGADFSITYSPNWDVGSLKHGFELEVHRLDMDCEVIWFAEKNLGKTLYV
jgi:hypothetical protein